jgi:hypothetical protein
MADEHVRDWQNALRAVGYNIAADADFGAKTLEASMDSLHADGPPPPATVPYEIPEDWLPKSSKMTKIIAHWTAGSHKVSATDKEHYHFIWDGDGNVVRGENPVTDNENTSDGDYAAHTKNCNTGSIGVSMACMAGAVENPFSSGAYPMTRAQWDGMCRGIAQLCVVYKIAVTPRSVLSHGEVQQTLGIAQSGKWDFTRLSWDLSVVGATACGNLMRSHVSALL